MKARTYLAGTLFVAAGCGGVLSGDLEISRETLQEAVSQQFPLSSEKMTESDVPIGVTLSHPEILLADGTDRIGIEVQVDVDLPDDAVKPPRPKLPPPPGPPGLSGSGPRPSSESSADAGPPSGKVAVFVGIRYEAATGEFYLQDPTIQQTQIGDLPPQFKQPVEKLVELALTEYLSRHPVYKLGDDDPRSRTAKAVLKSVSVRDGKLVIGIGV